MNPTTLISERLLLRPWTSADVDAVLAYAADEEFGRYTVSPYPYFRQNAEEFIAQRLSFPWETHPAFAIELGGVAVGEVIVSFDTSKNLAEMGYGIERTHWGQGHITEAASVVLAWTFDNFGVAKVLARADSRNVGSWRVMEKLGMQREGLLRSQRLLRGVRSDEVVYGILREEFIHRRRV